MAYRLAIVGICCLLTGPVGCGEDRSGGQADDAGGDVSGGQDAWLDVSSKGSNDAGADGAPGAGDSGAASLDFINLRAEEVTAERAVIRFKTSRPTTCVVAYGTSRDTLDKSATDPNMAPGELSEDHNVPLEDLKPETTYYYRGAATDGQGNSFKSAIKTFKTEAATQKGPNLVNFALSSQGTKVADVSSNFGGGDNNSTWGALKALDGKMGSEWATNGDGDKAFLTVDLGQTRTITHVGFRSRKMTDGTSIIEQFQLRFDGGKPVGPFDSPDPDKRYQFKLDNPVDARMVRLEATKTTGGNTGAKEIELLGSKSHQ